MKSEISDKRITTQTCYQGVLRVRNRFGGLNPPAPSQKFMANVVIKVSTPDCGSGSGGSIPLVRPRILTYVATHINMVTWIGII